MAVPAKQVATLAQLSGGRVILGVGTGAYREEYEALFPDAKDVHRGTMVDEGMKALRLLFTERKATFRGRYVKFEDVECFPKPAQSPMPIYAGGNHPEVRRRAGEYAQGWMPAVLAPEEIETGVEEIHRFARGGARRQRLDIAPQFAVPSAYARGGSDALPRARSSTSTSNRSRPPDQAADGRFEQRSLIGSPEEICERVRVYRRPASPPSRACSSSPTRCPRCRSHRAFGAKSFRTSIGVSMDSHHRGPDGGAGGRGPRRLVATSRRTCIRHGFRSIRTPSSAASSCTALFTRARRGPRDPSRHTGVAADRSRRSPACTASSSSSTRTTRVIARRARVHEGPRRQRGDALAPCSAISACWAGASVSTNPGCSPHLAARGRAVKDDDRSGYQHIRTRG